VSAVLSSEGPFGLFADRLLTLELPALPDSSRSDTVAFVCRRADQVPSPLRLGVMMLSVGVGIGQRVLGIDRTTSLLRDTTLPLVGELARMVRSLGFAYIWETWPDTLATGSQQ
jgi:hypothetical protein